MKANRVFIILFIFTFIPVHATCSDNAKYSKELLAEITGLSHNVMFSNGVAKITGESHDGNPIKIEVRTTKYSQSFPYREGFSWGADDIFPPTSVITSIKGRIIGAGDIFVPLSAYSDLADPFILSLENTPKGFRLVITGGDAGCSYAATLVFENIDIQRRKVVHGEFPDEAWEETVYSPPIEDDGR